MGDRAPDFTLKTLDGVPVTLSKVLRRGPALVNFYTLDCKFCGQELPHLHLVRRVVQDDEQPALRRQRPVGQRALTNVGGHRGRVESHGLEEPGQDTVRVEKSCRPPSLAASTLKPGGTTSPTVTLVAGASPGFVTLSVYSALRSR